MKGTIRICSLVLVASAAIGACGRTEPTKREPMSAAELVKKVGTSIVRIRTAGLGSKRESELAGDPPLCQTAPDSLGTGFFITDSGHILTNNHVVEEWALCRRSWPNIPLEVTLPSAEIVNATLIGRDPDTDLAVIKIDRKGVPSLAFADFTRIEVGQEVVAIGFPLASLLPGEATVTKGIVSAKDRAMGELADLVQTDATINHGNSGGPLLNLFAEVVGVNTIKLGSLATITPRADGSQVVDVDVTENLNFAVSSRIAERISGELISMNKVSRAVLGVTRSEAINETGALRFRLLDEPFSVGILVEEIASDSPVSKILKACDVVEQLGSFQIRSLGDLNNALLWIRSGETVKMQYRRYPPNKCSKVPDSGLFVWADPSRPRPRPTLSDPDSFLRGIRIPGRARDGDGDDYRKRIQAEQRIQVLNAKRDEGVVLTADVTLR